MQGSATRRILPGSRPLAGLVFGTLGAVAVGVAFANVTSESHRVTEAMFLIVPIIAAAITGGRRAALIVSLVATFTFSLLIPPIGTPRIHLVSDAVALGAFLGLAMLMGMLVAGRLDLLTEIDRQRSLLLRSVSHDLRTPLASIRAAASEIAIGSAEALELAELIGDESERLDRLVANLLSLSRMESRAPRLNIQPVDLNELVVVVVARQRRLLASTPLELAPTPELPMVEGDHALLEQVVVNLIENAVRHGGAGQPIGVSITQDGRYLVLEVTDHGPGVPVEDRQAIFEPFRSCGHGRSTGVGLAICHAVATAHGGTVRVGDAAGGGASFSLRLPVRRPHPPRRG